MTDYEKKWKQFEQEIKDEAKIYVAGCKKALKILDIPEPDHNIHKEFFIGNYVIFGMGRQRHTLMDQYRYRFLRLDNLKGLVWLKKMKHMHCADDPAAGFDEYAYQLQEFTENLASLPILRRAQWIQSQLKSIKNHEERIQQLNRDLLEHKSKIKENRNDLQKYLQEHHIDLSYDMPSVEFKRIEKALDSNKKYVSKRVMALKTKCDL
jgi:hypothetical protein